MATIPEFTTDEELAEWVETHDLSDYMDDLEEATERFKVVRTYFPISNLDIRLPTPYARAIESYASRKGLSYQTLIRTWLLEKLHQEAPDLMPH
jgi:predicted DNA binding CopG/RHH family protein